MSNSFVIGSDRYELGPVENRTAAPGKDEIDVLAAGDLSGLHQRLVPGIRFYSSELEDLPVSEHRFHLVDETALLRASTSIGYQGSGADGDVCVDGVEPVPAEYYSGWVVEIKVQQTVASR